MTRSGFTARRKHTRRIITLLILIAAAGLTIAALSRGANLFRERTDVSGRVFSISDLWNEGRYGDVARLAEERLAEDPMDRDALLYAGYARFFLAISRLSAEERLDDLNSSIRYLRMLKTRGGTPHPERVDYILGKAYLTKGPYWADLAAAYLHSSLEAGYEAEDSYEYLGRAYSSLGDTEEALAWYQLAARTHPTDRLLITLGEEAFKIARYNDAAAYYIQAIEQTRDDSLKKRGLSQLGQLYYDVGNYTEARGVLERLVEMEPGNADYQFLLGETYHEMDMPLEARRTWFAVTRIDPGHVGALRRLYD